MFLRFALKRLNGDSGERDGFFSAAYELAGRPDAPVYLDHLEEHLAWFRRELATPPRFNRSTSKGASRRNARGLSWFKPTAKVHIARAYAMRLILEEHGFATELMKSHRPGYVVYDDDHQIVAEPFKTTAC
jgi:hypothetical protein